MWRREEGIAAWLAGGRCPGSRQPWFKAWRLAARVGRHIATGEVPLTISACVNRDEVDLVPGRIVDGLAAYCVQDTGSARGSVHEQENAGVVSLELLGKARIGESMLVLDDASIRALDLVRTPRLKSPIAFPMKSVRVRHGGLLEDRARVYGGSGWLVKTCGSVCNGSPMVSGLPHRRTSIDLGRLSSKEIEELLLEAESMKGWATGSGKLVAVFSRVPVEVIDSVAIIDSGKRLVYTVSKSLRHKRTRIHDLAAVLDTDTKAIHLIPHRSRYHTVTLM